MVYGRSGHACAVHDDYLYVFGGVQSAAVQSNDRMYIGDVTNIASYTWQALPYIVGNNVYFQRAVVNTMSNFIYLIGGRDDINGIPSDWVQVFDPTTLDIELVSVPLSVGRSSPAAIFVEDYQRIFIFGGVDADGNELASWEYSNILGTTKDPTSQNTVFPTISPTVIPTTAGLCRFMVYDM